MTHTFNFMTTVVLERDSGKFAGRDEMSDKIEEALDEALGNLDVSGIGPESDSEYSVSEYSSYQVERRDQTKINAEYDTVVAAEQPSESDKGEIIKKLRAALKAEKQKSEQLARKVAALQEVREQGASRIYQGSYDEPKTYFADGRYDDVYFQFGVDDGDVNRISVRFDGDSAVEVRSDFRGGESLGVFPVSGNVFRIQKVAR